MHSRRSPVVRLTSIFGVGPHSSCVFVRVCDEIRSQKSYTTSSGGYPAYCVLENLWIIHLLMNPDIWLTTCYNACVKDCNEISWKCYQDVCGYLWNVSDICLVRQVLSFMQQIFVISTTFCKIVITSEKYTYTIHTIYTKKNTIESIELVNSVVVGTEADLYRC